MSETASSPLGMARAIYRDIPIYAPDQRLCDCDLSDNTNRFGVPPAASLALTTCEGDAIARYPSATAHTLRAALARYVGVASENIVTGCGSDDVIDSAIRACSEPGDRLAYPDPTFAMVPLFARMNGLAAVPVPWRNDGDLDTEALIGARARVIYLCSPNNPTGGAASCAAIERVLEGARGLVILDEAYAEFAGDGFASQAPSYPRLLVVRTLSKAFGLAGLRIGYGVGNPALVTEVAKSRGPFKVSAPAERAGVAALSEDLAWVRARIGEAVASRERLAAALRDRGFAPLPSVANFVLVPVADAARTATAMRQRGVAVRPFASLTGIGDAIRITVAPWPLMERALAALDEISS